MTNFEFKARLENFARVRQVLQQRRAHFAGVLRQTDTYFLVPNGRLKLRETRRHGPAEGKIEVNSQLIFYQRADAAALKRSDYSIVNLDRAEDLHEILAAALGRQIVIKKSRELFLLGYEGAVANEGEIHIRIHLDRVEELGDFIEVEALANGVISSERAEQTAQALLEEFGIAKKDLMAGSYSDLLSEKRAT